MKRQLAAYLLGAVLFISLSHQSAGVSQKNGVITGQIQFPEISGATMLPGDRLLFVADEGNDVFLIEGAAKRLGSGKVAKSELQRVESEVELDDLEDVAWDRASSVYLVSSHSRNRQGKDSAKRYQIALLQLEADGKPKGPITEVSQRMRDAIPQDLQSATERTPAQCGFNIEGASFNEAGQLLLGLRSPTQTSSIKREDKLQEDAIVLRLNNPTKLFPPAKEKLEVEQVVLNLGAQGIRGMHYDPEQKGHWIIANLSPDPNYDVRDVWALWFWDGKNPPRRAQVPAEAAAHLHSPEAVCRIMIQGRPHLLLIEDGEKNSRYVLFPIPKL